MIKCIECNSNKVILKLEESKYMVINECYNCYNIIHLFIDDYVDNYKNYNSIDISSDSNTQKEKDTKICQKHSKDYISFCFNCNINLCNECLLSHDSSLHSISSIKQIITQNDIKENQIIKNHMTSLKEEINKKIEFNKQNKEYDYNNLLNSLLNIIKIKEKLLNLNINDDEVNTYDIVSLKNLLHKYNKVHINLLIKNIKSLSYEEKENDIKHYKNCKFISIKSIPNNKIIHKEVHGWVNHVIQLKNTNIVSAHWDFLLVFKINHENNTLEQIQRININNGSINHIYEYKKNKILILDNKMKIIQLSPDNQQFKCLNILDYGRKIIPFIPDPKTNTNKKFLFTATPNGIKLYSYLDDNEDDNEFEYNNFEDIQIENDLKFIGVFSIEYDYSAIIQINNKICGIFKIKNNSNNHCVVWEINYDFNDESKFDINKFKLLGQVNNVHSAIGRYSISKINDDYALIGIMKYNYHTYLPNEKSGIAIISLNPVEIIQYIKTDEITSIECLKNNIILTGGKDLNNNKYYIKEWKYDKTIKELLYVGKRQMHSDFINAILEIKDGFFISCGRGGHIYIVYYYMKGVGDGTK